MSHNRLHLNRDKLAQFLKSHEQIRQFEELFSTTNDHDDEITIINGRLGDLENPPGTTILVDHQADTEAYWLIAGATGKTITLPKCVGDIVGRTWYITLGVTGDVTIETFAGDSIPTPSNPAETTVILNRRGSTVAFRCVSTAEWVFA